MLLDIRGLNVAIPVGTDAVNAVRRVDLRVARGSIHGLIGESGSGKTMTGMALLGLAPAVARIEAEQCDFDNAPLLPRTALLRGRRISAIAQNPAASLNPVLSIGRQIGDVLKAAGMASRAARRDRSIELLEAVGLRDAARIIDSHPHRLSGGMQQRVVIALALATGAEFLIADEPTTALDVVVAAQFVKLLQQLVAERALTVLLISHDLDLVAEACDSATVLYAGTTVETGRAADLLARPSHPYTKALRDALPESARPGEPLRFLKGQPPTPTAAHEGCPFAGLCDMAMPACATTRPPKRTTPGGSAWCHLEFPDV